MKNTLLGALAILAFVSAGSCSTGAAVEDSGWEGARLGGRIVDEEGRPVAGCLVYAYIPERGTMGPAEAMSEESGADGSYVLLAPPGEYVVVARKRASGAVGGALRNGDLHGRLPEPVRMTPSSPVRRDLEVRLFQQGSEGDPRKVLSTETRVSGRVQDRQGRPIEGAHAFAYQGSFSTRPPDFLSAPTDAAGRFSLSLPGGGSYVIGARTGLRGRPRSNDMLGFWQDDRRASHVEDGAVIEDAVVVIVRYGKETESPSAAPAGED